MTLILLIQSINSISFSSQGGAFLTVYFHYVHYASLHAKYLRKGYLQASREYFSCLPYVWHIYLYKKNFSHHNSKKQIKK